MRPAKSQPLVLGIDYYMEGDKFVFTAEYHKKRGYCCNSSCRHCPYKDAEVIQVPAIPPLSLPGKR